VGGPRLPSLIVEALLGEEGVDEGVAALRGDVTRLVAALGVPG
jgi:hypothetical protein